MALEFLDKIKQLGASTFIQSQIKKLYDLLYPYIAADFRGIEDCTKAMGIVDVHTHPYIGAGLYSTPQISQPPIAPSAVTNVLALAKVGVDPQSGLPARVGTSITIKPFKVL